MAIILDNSNLNESYAGVTTPLTYSFASRIYGRVYRQFCQTMGVSRRLIAEHDSYFDSMLASVGGRLYYNLNSWHHMIALLPAYTVNGPFLEQMMGIDAKNTGKVRVPKSQKIVASVTTLYITVRMVFIFITMPIWHWYFNRRFSQKYDRFTKLLHQDLDIETMLMHYLEAETTLTQDFRIPIINDFAVMISTGIINKSYESAPGSKNKTLSFHAGQGVLSAKPGRGIAELIAFIQSSKEYVSLFAPRNSPEMIYSRLKNYPQLASKIEEYAQDYGYRVPGELKLESLTFFNNTTYLLRFLQRQVQTTLYNGVSQVQHQREENWRFLPWYLRWMSSWAKNSLTRREQTRFQRTLIFGLTRDLFTAIGKKLVEQKWIATERDVFYLTVEEILRASSSAETRHYMDLIRERQKDAEYYATLDIPPHLELSSYPLKNYRPYEIHKTPVVVSSITGQVASRAGRCTLTGTALVLDVFDNDADYQNKIVITHQTDPGWTIIFPFVRGIIVERGGLLSHAAIVAREFQIPCIINTKEATRQIPNGSEVTMDLVTGEITWENN